jgi:gliding motility-associated-like protein
MNDSLFNKEVFDFEARNSYEIRIRSTLVNGMYVEKTFKMNVLNVNERPTFLSINKDSIPENTTDSIYVASFSTIDPDKGDRFVYTLVSGANDAGNKAFTIKNGILLLVKPANFEKQSSYKIRVRTTDAGGEFLDSVFTIYVKDVNEQCRIVPQTYEILELAEQQTQLGSIEVKDDDKNQNYLFEIQNPDVPFSINATTGMLSLNGRIDYEKKRYYDVWVKITDSGSPALSDSLNMRVNVLDEIEDDILPSADLVSPNGDEKNDTWKITNVGLYKDFALDIVDENGQSVYSISSNYNNDWDAKFRGSPLPSGVYYYVFKSNTSGKLYKGYITVVK